MFVLCECFDYEGEAVIGLYASEEDAIAAADRYRESRTDSQGRVSIDELAIYQLEVGAAAELRSSADMYL